MVPRLSGRSTFQSAVLSVRSYRAGAVLPDECIKLWPGYGDSLVNKILVFLFVRAFSRRSLGVHCPVRVFSRFLHASISFTVPAPGLFSLVVYPGVLLRFLPASNSFCRF